MKIVYIDSFTANPGDLSFSELEGLGEFKAYERTPVGEVLERCKDADAILTNKVTFMRETIEQLPKLKYIGVTATGTNIVDLDFAKENNIQVTNVPGYSTDSVAQHVIAMILHLSSKVALHNDSVHNDDWVNSADFCYTLGPINEVCGKTLGIIGLGGIGRKVALIANAMGMKIVAAHQSSMNRLELPYDVEWLPADEVFPKADFLSLNCPLTEQTDKIVNSKRLASMKSSAVVINTGRGPLIDEAALAEALNNHTIAGAALDVLSAEPPTKDNPLLKATNCIITPHIAWASCEARTRLLNTVTTNLKSFIDGSTNNLVN